MSTLPQGQIASLVKLARALDPRSGPHEVTPEMCTQVHDFLTAATFSDVVAVRVRKLSDTMGGAKPHDLVRSTADLHPSSPFVAYDEAEKPLRLETGWFCRVLKDVWHDPSDRMAEVVVRNEVHNAEMRARPISLAQGHALHWGHPWMEGISLGISGRAARLLQWDGLLELHPTGYHKSSDCDGGELILVRARKRGEKDALSCKACKFKVELKGHLLKPGELRDEREKALAKAAEVAQPSPASASEAEAATAK